MIMDVRPMLNCTDPQYIYNKYTNEYKLVPCGRCKACIVHRQRSMSLRCQLESKTHKFCMFVTLTFDNDHLPLAYPIVEDNFDGTFQVKLFNSCLRLHKYYSDDEILSDVSISPKIYNLLLKKFNMNGMIPFLSTYDSQLFIKRFRKNLSAACARYIKKRLQYHINLLDKYAELHPHADISNHLKKIEYYAKKKPEKIRYYCCGELGPEHYRPHFHFLFWFDDEITLSQFSESLRKSWTFGRLDYSISRGDAASYCASYINSTVDLPEIFTNGRLKPKSYHSQKLGEEIFPCPYEKIQEHDHIAAITTSIPLNDRNTELRMWRSLTSRFMPLCKGYRQKTDEQRLYSYTIYGKVAKWTGQISPYLQAKQLTDLILRLGFDTPELYKYCLLNEPKHLLEITRYFRSSLHIDSMHYNPVDGCIEKIRCAFMIMSIDQKDGHYKFVDHEKFDLYEFLLQGIYRELRISRDFEHLAGLPGYHYYRKTLDLITEFYDALEIDQLNRNYQTMQDLLNSELSTTEQVYQYYTNLDWNYLYDYDQQIKWFLKHTPIMRLLQQKSHEDFEKSIKHKSLNDKNKIFHSH